MANGTSLYTDKPVIVSMIGPEVVGYPFEITRLSILV